MSNFVGPSVGRIVHFFTKNEANHSNGQGAGPYPAIVLQCFEDAGDANMANLKVMTWTGDRLEGSVAEKTYAEANGHQRWWEWPPRV